LPGAPAGSRRPLRRFVSARAARRLLTGLRCPTHGDRRNAPLRPNPGRKSRRDAESTAPGERQRTRGWGMRCTKPRQGRQKIRPLIREPQPKSVCRPIRGLVGCRAFPGVRGLTPGYILAPHPGLCFGFPAPDATGTHVRSRVSPLPRAPSGRRHPRGRIVSPLAARRLWIGRRYPTHEDRKDAPLRRNPGRKSRIRQVVLLTLLTSVLYGPSPAGTAESSPG